MYLVIEDEGKHAGFIVGCGAVHTACGQKTFNLKNKTLKIKIQFV